MKAIPLARWEFGFLLVVACVAIVLTMWFPFRSYFLINGRLEQVDITTDNTPQVWVTPAATLITCNGDEVALSEGELLVFPRSHLIFRRIGEGPAMVFIETLGAVKFPPAAMPRAKAIDEDDYPITIQFNETAIREAKLVLPFLGVATIGRSPIQPQTTSERPLIFDGTVEIQTRAFDGRSVVSSTDQRLFAADRARFVEGRNGNGIINFDSERGFGLFYSVNAKYAVIDRFGASSPIVIRNSITGRVAADPVLKTVWSAFAFFAAIIFVRRSLKEKS